MPPPPSSLSLLFFSTFGIPLARLLFPFADDVLFNLSWFHFLYRFFMTYFAEGQVKREGGIWMSLERKFFQGVEVTGSFCLGILVYWKVF